MTYSSREPRPGVLTFVGIVLYLNAAISAVAGVVMLLERTDTSFQSTTGQTADELLVLALAEFVVAMALFAVASGIMWGAPWARVVTAVVLGIQLMVSTYGLIAHEGGGVQWNAVITAGLAVFVLWALYGNSESQQYFASYE
jgi:hypothetical protein